MERAVLATAVTKAYGYVTMKLELLLGQEEVPKLRSLHGKPTSHEEQRP